MKWHLFKCDFSEFSLITYCGRRPGRHSKKELKFSGTEVWNDIPIEKRCLSCNYINKLRKNEQTN